MEQIFDGLKVVEFTAGGVGPIMGRYLADHGATVVRVESELHPCITRMTAPWKGDKPNLDKAGYFTLYNTSKYGLALNLGHPRVGEVTKRLVTWADVIIDSFAPGVMRRWGLDYESVCRIKPDTIMISSSNAGQTGPYSTQPAYGIHLNGLGGFSYLTGWPDREPNNPSMAYSDFISPALGACAVVAALIHRRKTGKGQYIDHSQLEASLNFLSPLFLDFQASGRKYCRDGNRVPGSCPHNAYRCRGDDRWCAISVTSEDEWLALCDTMGKRDLARDARFASLQARKANEAALDSVVENWTSDREAIEVMETLQARGVPAGVVYTMADFFADPQIRHRNFMQMLDHPDLGQYHYFGNPFIFSKTPSNVRRSPCLGEHTAYVLETFLGFGAEEIAALSSEGVLS